VSYSEGCDVTPVAEKDGRSPRPRSDCQGTPNETGCTQFAGKQMADVALLDLQCLAACFCQMMLFVTVYKQR
jgi:hypothetical protein